MMHKKITLLENTIATKYIIYHGDIIFTMKIKYYTFTSDINFSIKNYLIFFDNNFCRHKILVSVNKIRGAKILIMIFNSFVTNVLNYMTSGENLFMKCTEKSWKKTKFLNPEN